ncbi:MAG TPA: DUF1854 domain-containing protein [Limnochordia bacterium]
MSEVLADLPRLDARRLRFEESSDHTLFLHVDGVPQGPVDVRQAFPLTQPGRYLVVTGRDGSRIGLLVDAGRLDARSRQTLEQHLERLYFTPKITRVDEITLDTGYMYWQVQTDRGPRRFHVRSRRDDVRWIDASRLIIRDVDGNRDEVTDFQKLDRRSRAILELELGG